MVIDGIILKGRRIIIPVYWQKRALDQLHVEHMSIQKTRLLVYEYICWININADIENAIKTAMYVLIFSQHSQKIRCCHMRYQAGHGNPSELTFLSINSKHYLCIVGYHSKFPVINRPKGTVLTT